MTPRRKRPEPLRHERQSLLRLRSDNLHCAENLRRPWIDQNFQTLLRGGPQETSSGIHLKRRADNDDSISAFDQTLRFRHQVHRFAEPYDVRAELGTEFA